MQTELSESLVGHGFGLAAELPASAWKCGLEHFHNCCGADWLICGRLAIGLLDSTPQAKRIANPLQDTILPHSNCENALTALLNYSGLICRGKRRAEARRQGRSHAPQNLSR
jgi:hypothetical protein